MKKLELKHLAPYLPYGLKVQYIGELDDNNERHDSSYIRIGEIANLGSVEFRFTNPIYWIDFKRGYFGITSFEFKPILRPLSDLINNSCYELLSNNLRFNIDMLGFPNHLDLKVNDYNILLENHFDVFGLIEKRLAIDINTLNQEL